jgi:tRNA G18 (ribose-2'-O)-methylase SpoU
MARIEIVIIVHNIRSTHNVGSLLRSADGFGIKKIYFTGYTPYPKMAHDKRLPHLSTKANNQIHKTALGAENSVAWEHNEDITEVIRNLKDNGYEIAALEQTKKSEDLRRLVPASKIAVILGNEVEGLDQETLGLTDVHLEIPIHGQKESFNVAIAGSIAMYVLSTLDKGSA